MQERVAPLGRPRSVYKSDVECRFVSQNDQNDLEGQGQWPPLSMPAESIPEYIFGANLMILAQIYDELSRRQAEFPRILSQNGQNDLEVQSQWPLFSIPAQCIPGCMFGANLVILSQMYDELSHGEAKFPRILSQNGQNDIEGQGQLPPFSTSTECFPGCIFGAHLVILAQIYEEVSRAEAKFPRNLSQNGQNDLEGQGQWPPFPIPAMMLVWWKFGDPSSNLWRVIVRTR